MKRTFKNVVGITFFLLGISNVHVFGQCVSAVNVHTFTYDGKNYELIKENKSWENAAACAVERGGKLIEINDAAEQDAIFLELSNNGNITNSNTVAPDGGGGSYVWLGGNDIQVEGEWVWDGDNDLNMVQFWQGTSSGSAVGGLYSNWGNEPDDWGGQDGLALSLNGWPLGMAGEWNDVDDSNLLYFIVEYPLTNNVIDIEDEKFLIYPNPVESILQIQSNGDTRIDGVKVINSIGKEVQVLDLKDQSFYNLNLSTLEKGVYWVEIRSGNYSVVKKIIKG